MTASKQNGLTESQAKVLKTVSDFIAENGYSPTAKEIAEILNVTQTSVFEQLSRLEKKRYITRQKGAARTIGILEQNCEKTPKNDGVKLVKVPVIGTIAAGVPIFADENMEGEILVDESNIGKGRFFALRVRGDSMINAGINNGDLVIIKRQPLAENGDIIAALIESEATLKRLSLSNGEVFLLPENEKYSPINVTCREDFRILGKMVTTVTVL
ncbi:transcriptional repressor LexA [bacterium]|jgi:repressor LexA|nr:transcriptional repressor LexA [bacterium]MBP5590447.1 transcriptional repressor LexA [bacterium]